jgi:hypothetical protein
MLAGMKSEQVAGFVSESMAGFIGIRTLPLVSRSGPVSHGITLAADQDDRDIPGD